MSVPRITERRELTVHGSRWSDVLAVDRATVSELLSMVDDPDWLASLDAAREAATSGEAVMREPRLGQRQAHHLRGARLGRGAVVARHSRAGRPNCHASAPVDDDIMCPFFVADTIVAVMPLWR